jgi:hypothetical protein
MLGLRPLSFAAIAAPPYSWSVSAARGEISVGLWGISFAPVCGWPAGIAGAVGAGLVLRRRWTWAAGVVLAQRARAAEPLAAQPQTAGRLVAADKLGV